MSGDTSALLKKMLENTYTQADMYRRLSVLRQCVEYAVFTDTGMSYEEECTLFLSKIDNQEDAVAVQAWGDDVFRVFTKMNISKTMKDLQEAVDALPLLKLYVPVEFPEDEVGKTAKMCREKLREGMLLDMHVDPQVAGGCAFVWDDTHHDFSFHSRMKAVPGAITSELQKYADE